ncbi:MAG: DNA recombination protein RmuC [Leptothrix sp. (in: b-proteobacteria)]
MTSWLALFQTAVLLGVLALLLWQLSQRADGASAQALLDELQRQHLESQRLERELRGEVQASARQTRQELAQTLSLFQQTLLAQSGDVARTQNEQLRTLTEANDRRLTEVRQSVEQRLAGLQHSIEQRLTLVQQSVDQRLSAMQLDNERKLEQMRATVDEKLHATLEQRLGESFKLVADRLDRVHHGLGEMQTLAQGVGDLRRVLTNVKSRGLFGEVQLGALLEQVFTTEQYGVNVVTIPGSNDRVEYAIRLPGRTAQGPEMDQPVWLPIDAKFPREDYERLLDAQDRADRDAADAALKALEQRIRDEAKSIAAKYLAPPHTTDFAILFVPTEGLYAELLRRPGLADAMQRQYRVMLAGPTTVLALLNSLQMGFRTLALERRSTEVWQILGGVKTEFAKFGDILEKTRKKLQEASNTIESAEVRTRAMARQLKSVEALPGVPVAAVLPLPEALPGSLD